MSECTETTDCFLKFGIKGSDFIRGSLLTHPHLPQEYGPFQCKDVTIGAFHRIFLGAHKGTEGMGFTQASDISTGETGLALAVIALWLVLGLYPMLFIQPVEKTILTIGAAGGLAGLP